MGRRRPGVRDGDPGGDRSMTAARFAQTARCELGNESRSSTERRLTFSGLSTVVTNSMAGRISALLAGGQREPMPVEPELPFAQPT